jgi:hypothetical protein
MNQYYRPEDIEKYGVLGVEIKVIVKSSESLKIEVA